MRDWLLANGQDKESVVSLRAAVDTSSPGSKEGPSAGELRVGYAGGCRPRRRHWRLSISLAAWQIARLRVRHGRCRAPGGEVRRSYRSRGAPVWLPRSRSTTFTRILASLDVLVVPSVLDGRPVVRYSRRWRSACRSLHRGSGGIPAVGARGRDWIPRRAGRHRDDRSILAATSRMIQRELRALSQECKGFR